MSEWDATSYEGKDTILRVVRDEAQRLFAMAEQPGAWDAPTACESWRVRDVIGHLVDTTEGYFQAFETATSGAAAADAYGLPGMHERAKLAGGKLAVWSAPDSGTEIELTILTALADVKASPAAQTGASGQGS